ncbi:hypothetical protein D3C71_2054160 [compost metagenome]
MSRLRAVCVELRAMLLSQGRQQGLTLALTELTFLSRVLRLQGGCLLQALGQLVAVFELLPQPGELLVRLLQLRL